LTFAMVFFVNLFPQKRRISNYFFVVLSSLGIIFANHRSAYTCLLLTTAIGAWLFKKAESRIKIVVLLIATTASIFLLFSQNLSIWDNFTQRLSSLNLQDENVQVRLEGWDLALERFREGPINGSLLSNEYYQPSYYDQIPPHGFIFEILPTQGIVGLAFWIYLFIASLAIGYRNRYDEVSLQMFLTLLFYISFSLFNATLLNEWSVLILILAISIILYRNKILSKNQVSIGNK